MLILTNFLWRRHQALSTPQATTNAVIIHGGVEPQNQCTYLRLGLVAASAATLNFELQILILLVAMGKKLPIIHFRLAPLEYERNKKYIDNMDVKW